MLLKYFSNISDLQRRQFADLEPLYREWNAKINVVSRKDIDNLMLHHVLHSLAIAKAFEPAGAAGLPAFEDGDRVLDVGTGGGFPGIPLAILFPEVKFIKAQARVGAAFSFVVSRAVTDLSNFLPWVKGGYSKGIYYLKGGNVTDAPLFADRGALLQEIDVALKKNGLSRDNVKIFNICDAFEEEFFEQKRVLFISDKKF